MFARTPPAALKDAPERYPRRPPSAPLPLLVVAFLAALLLASCGTGAAAGGPSGGGNPAGVKRTPLTLAACDLITADDAAAALGGPVGASARSGGGGEIVITDCAYRASGETTRKVSLMVRHPQNPALARQEWESARPALERNVGATTHAVADLGEGAFWAEGEGVHQLTVLRGDLQLIVSTSGLGGDAETAATRLATAALGRLP